MTLPLLPQSRLAQLCLLISMIFGVSYYFGDRQELSQIGKIIWKGGGLAFLSLYALFDLKSKAGRIFTIALVFGALGDMVLELSQTGGAIFFLIGHLIAIYIYYQFARTNLSFVSKACLILLAVFIIGMSWYMCSGTPLGLGVALYATPLAIMTASALASRFPLKWVGLGAVLFALSDMLIFARIGEFWVNSPAFELIWPFYYLGQLLIAIGVVSTIRSWETKGAV